MKVVNFYMNNPKRTFWVKAGKADINENNVFLSWPASEANKRDEVANILFYGYGVKNVECYDVGHACYLEVRFTNKYDKAWIEPELEFEVSLN